MFPLCLCLYVIRLKVIYWTAQSQGVAGSTGLSELDDQVVVMGERIASLQCCYSPKAEPQRLSSAAVNTAVGLFHARYVIMQELRFGRRALHDWHPLRYSAQADGSVNTGTYPLASLLLPPVSSGPLTNITTLHLPRVGLTVFDTRGMVNLEELNLEGNRLVVRKTSCAYHHLFFCASCSSVCLSPSPHRVRASLAWAG